MIKLLIILLIICIIKLIYNILAVIFQKFASTHYVSIKEKIISYKYLEDKQSYLINENKIIPISECSIHFNETEESYIETYINAYNNFILLLLFHYKDSGIKIYLTK